MYEREQSPVTPKSRTDNRRKRIQHSERHRDKSQRRRTGCQSCRRVCWKPSSRTERQPVPAEADYVGYNDNGTLVGVSLTSPLPVMDIPIVQNVIVTTGVLANNASVETTAQIPGPFQLLWITVSAFCRVRAYSTAAAQAADLSRPSSQTPTPATSTGIISDAVLTSSLALGYLDTYGLNGDTPASNTIYLTITNLSGAPAAISINVAYTDS